MLWQEILKFPVAKLAKPTGPCGQKGKKQLKFIEKHSNFTKVLKEEGKQQIWFSEDIFLDSKIYSWVINLPWSRLKCIES